MALPASDITVAILDSSDLLCDGLEALLDGTPGLAFAGAWTHVEEAVPHLSQDRPDVLLLDLQMPGRSALDLLSRLPALSPFTRVIVMVDCPEDRCILPNPHRCCDHCGARTAGCAASGDLSDVGESTREDCLQTALKMGVRGAIQKRRRFHYIVEVIRSVFAGRHWMELPTARRLAQQYLGAANGPALARTETLTPREREIAALVAQGRSNKEICEDLHLGYSTVKNYVSSILEKLDLRDRTQIALYAIEHAVPPLLLSHEAEPERGT